MANHTPGPWERDHITIWSPGSQRMVAQLGEPEPQTRFVEHHKPDRGSENWAEITSNGDMISAAPDLLAACQAAVAAIKHNADSGESDCDCDGDCETAFALWTEAESLLTAAIAKARGEAVRVD